MKDFGSWRNLSQFILTLNDKQRLRHLNTTKPFCACQVNLNEWHTTHCLIEYHKLIKINCFCWVYHFLKVKLIQNKLKKKNSLFQYHLFLLTFFCAAIIKKTVKAYEQKVNKRLNKN